MPSDSPNPPSGARFNPLQRLGLPLFDEENFVELCNSFDDHKCGTELVKKIRSSSFGLTSAVKSDINVLSI